MNTEKIIEDQVELYVLEQQMPLTYADPLRNALRRAVDQAIQQEREACAKMCDDRVTAYQYATDVWAQEHIDEARHLAKAIRARGK